MFQKLNYCKRKWSYLLFIALLSNPVRFITGDGTEERSLQGNVGGASLIPHTNKQVVKLMRETVTKRFSYNGSQQSSLG